MLHSPCSFVDISVMNDDNATTLVMGVGGCGGEGRADGKEKGGGGGGATKANAADGRNAKAETRTVNFIIPCSTRFILPLTI